MSRILIADDHQIMREGLRSVLEKHPGHEVVGEAQNGRQALELTRKLKPDVVVMDISMPELNGIEAARQIVSALPQTKIIALSMHADRRYVQGMLAAGASGYLLKDCAIEELISAIRCMTAGQIFLSPAITGVVVKDYLNHPPSKDALTGVLSTREREVLQLIAEGRETKQIAATLFVSVKTIETHRRNIMEKLNLRSVADLTKFAIREGLTSVEG